MRSLIFILFLLLLIATGCAGSGRNMKSYSADSFPVKAGSGLIGDVMDRIVDRYPPGQTAVFLSGQGEFAQALEDALRDRGYAIAPESGKEALTVAWTLDRLDDDAWYLLVNLSDGCRFSRVYHDNGQGLIPEAGISQGMF